MTTRERLFSRLSKTRQSLSAGLLSLFKRGCLIDETLYQDIEDQLLMADLGVSTSQSLVATLREKAQRGGYSHAEQLRHALHEIILAALGNSPQTEINCQGRPQVILMVGVNGVGKTTTLAKMAHHYQESGNKIMLAACDTFRAAAIEQLQSWGARLNIPVIAQPHGSDAAAVAFDAYHAACARKIDYLLIDSAGRQHTHSELMEQLKKIKRVLAKANPDIPDEVLITVDAGNGQNIISQVENFQKAISLSGLCVTKLDGTARGGVVIALAKKFGLPIRFIGLGEAVTDLKPFNAEDFVAALLPDLSDD